MAKSLGIQGGKYGRQIWSRHVKDLFISLVYYCWISHETMQRYYFLIFVFLNFRIFFHVCRTCFHRICPQTKHFILFYYFLGRISELWSKLKSLSY